LSCGLRGRRRRHRVNPGLALRPGVTLAFVLGLLVIGQTVALNLPAWLRPAVPVTNLVFLALDRIDYRTRSTMNYTLVAAKGKVAAPDEFAMAPAARL